VTHSAAVGEGKKIDEGTMIPLSEHESESDPVAVPDPRETRNPTPVATKDASDILINCRKLF
jgi:hypothetical protein